MSPPTQQDLETESDRGHDPPEVIELDPDDPLILDTCSDDRPDDDVVDVTDSQRATRPFDIILDEA